VRVRAIISRLFRVYGRPEAEGADLDRRPAAFFFFLADAAAPRSPRINR